MNANAEGSASPLSKEFTSWKFNLLDAMLRDPKMKPVDFPVAYAIVQAVNQHTRVAIVSDQKLQLLVHRDRKALLRARTRLVSLGWVKVRTGRYGRATEYRFSDERAKLLENVRLDEQILAFEIHGSEAKATHCNEASNGAKAVHYYEPDTEAKTPHRQRDRKAPGSSSQWGKTVPHIGAVMPPLHLQTPTRETLPVKDIAPEACEAHVVVFDRYTEFEETAARLEFDEQLTRREAEDQARMICGIDNADADGRQDVRTAPPAVAKRNPETNPR
jgi:hypothetical protein